MKDLVQYYIIKKNSRLDWGVVTVISCSGHLSYSKNHCWSSITLALTRAAFVLLLFVCGWLSAVQDGACSSTTAALLTFVGEQQ